MKSSTAPLPPIKSVKVLDQVRERIRYLHQQGENRLFAQLLYGKGMRINEGLQLRVKDVDFELSTNIVRKGNGGKDRAVMLPQ